ncbi:hypothetical protein FS749_003012 [Ceratobasidium sp. UAMH 11750]|nr:hypothetical protein FS749_003012 [Ceratobasidium sp. UAMH 11750]
MPPKRKSAVKASLNRFKVGLRRLFRNRNHVLPDKESRAVDLNFTDWDGLEHFSDMLMASGAAFGPLTSAIERFSGCIKMFEDQARAREEYKKIGTDLNDLFHALAAHFKEIDPTSVAPDSFVKLARKIDEETKPFESDKDREPQDNGGVAQGPDKVLGCYSRVRTLLALFAMNESAKLWKVYDDELLNTLLERLPHTPNAHYHAACSNDARRTGCMPNTRIDVLQDLQDWVHYGKFQKVYWLGGIVGAGKTTVAYSLCEWLENTGKPHASCFCSRNLSACRDVKQILPGVAYQLARRSRPFRCAVSSALEQDPKVCDRPVNEQFKKLIAVPFNNTGHTFGVDVVVVLDALDECEDKDGVDQMLDACFKQPYDLPLRFLITSRRNSGILERMLASQPGPRRAELRLHEADRTVTQEDTKTYLGVKLERLGLSNDDLERLVQRSGGWFLYASSIVDYIDLDGVPGGSERLKRLLDITSYTDDPLDWNIHLLFTAILEEVVEETNLDDSRQTEVLLVLRTLHRAQGPMSIDAIAGLLSLNVDRLAHTVLRSLLPVLHVPNAGEMELMLYTPFASYLSDPQRSGRYHCDVQRDNELLARSCFAVFDTANPAFNVCNLESSYLLDREVTGIDERANESVSEALWYASRHWVTHLKLSGSSNDLFAALQNFLSKRLLLWLEIMNLKQCTSRAVEMLRGMHSWLQKLECPDIIQNLVVDARMFVAAFASSVVSESTPHISVSALRFWPAHRPVSKHYMPMLRFTVKTRGRRLEMRGDPLHDGIKEPVDQPLEGHTKAVSSVAYSPGGALVASGSWDNTIRIWDTQTGKPVGQPHKGHTHDVNLVSYSPDGAYIASGSDDYTVRIWHAQTGQLLGQPLKGHTGRVWSVAYSPDGAYIASGSDDHTIRIWDARTGQPVGQPLKGHIGSVYSVAYSPDGAYIVSGSDDRSVRIWDSRPGHGAQQDPALSSSIRPASQSSNFSLLPSTFARYITRISRKPALVSIGLPMLTPEQFLRCWAIDDQGWVLNYHQERLIWVPEDLREFVLVPPALLRIPLGDYVLFDFRGAKLGTEWRDCFDPSQLYP